MIRGVMRTAELDVASADVPVTPADHPTTGDRVFRVIATAGAATSLVIVTGFLYYLVNESRPAFAQSGVVDFFTESEWNPIGEFGVFGMLVGTIIIAALAMTLALPLSIGMALFVNEYAPPAVARVLTTAIDLLAAIPSLIFGMWGLLALDRQLFPVARWFGDNLVAIPIFRIDEDAAGIGRSAFVAGVVVGIMMLPIVTSISREVMARAPRDQCEGALALGGTRWGMIRAVILPFGRSGIIGGALLGFGRALGETIAVVLIIQQVYDINWHVLETGAGSIAAHIASRFGEATDLERSGLIAAGLALFLLTFAVNLIARIITRRSVPS